MFWAVTVNATAAPAVVDGAKPVTTRVGLVAAAGGAIFVTKASAAPRYAPWKAFRVGKFVEYVFPVRKALPEPSMAMPRP